MILSTQEAEEFYGYNPEKDMTEAKEKHQAEQFELLLDTPQPTAEEITIYHALLRLLTLRGHIWTKSTLILDRVHTIRTRRGLRDLIELCDDGSVSSSTHGYKLTCLLTPKEFNESNRNLLSRIRKLTVTQQLRQRNWHAQGHKLTTPLTPSTEN